MLTSRALFLGEKELSYTSVPFIHRKHISLESSMQLRDCLFFWLIGHRNWVNLDYGEEVHWSVRNFSPRQGYLSWYGGQGGKTIKSIPQVGVLRRPSFLSEGLRLPKKLDLWRTLLAKKCCHVGRHVIFFIQA